MEVLLLGAGRADVDAVAQQLTRFGHGVHRCAPPPDQAQSDALCAGDVHPNLCPLMRPIDVTIVVDSGPAAEGLEPIGIGCAIRDKVPMATIHPGEDPVAAATAALSARDTLWAGELKELLDRDDLRCTSHRKGVTLHVTITGDIDPNDSATTTRLSSRLYDIVRDQVPSGIRSIGVGVASGEAR